MLESGEYSTIREIAVAEKINETYVGRVMRLTLLAPDIVEARDHLEQPSDGPGRNPPELWAEPAGPAQKSQHLR